MSRARLLTHRQEIATVAERWKDQYFANGRWGGTDGAFAIYKKLKALNITKATPADVTKIIGNETWTMIRCDGCDSYVEKAVQVGATPEYESATTTLCVNCLRDAQQLLRGVRDA